MAQTSPFGPVRLSGEDARIFVWQLRYGRPKKAARTAIQSAERIRCVQSLVYGAGCYSVAILSPVATSLSAD